MGVLQSTSLGAGDRGAHSSDDHDIVGGLDSDLGWALATDVVVDLVQSLGSHEEGWARLGLKRQRASLIDSARVVASRLTSHVFGFHMTGIPDRHAGVTAHLLQCLLRIPAQRGLRIHRSKAHAKLSQCGFGLLVGDAGRLERSRADQLGGPA